jgi:hypothetical protein
VCTWFARHITIDADYTCHEYFWPCVEQYAKAGHVAMLRALDWPTHPNVLLSGYTGRNYSYARAGAVLAKRGDVETLMIMARHGGEYWSYWVYKAAKAGHGALIQVLYGSGLPHHDSVFGYGHERPFNVAVRKNRLDILRILGSHEKEDKTAYLNLAIEFHCDLSVLQYLGVTPAQLRSNARWTVGINKLFEHATYILRNLR